MLTPTKTIGLNSRKILKVNYFFKRIADYTIAFLLTIAFAPLMMMVAIAIKLDSPGPILFKQTRVGLNGRHFKVWKFRSMVSNSEDLLKELEDKNEIKGGIVFKIKKDPRVTRVGKIIREYSIDELPQLFNVLFGDMSLIGPRPLPLRDIEKMDVRHNIRHDLLPGITGLTQVSGRSDCTSDEFFQWDELYVTRWSLWLDLKILLKTVPAVIVKSGAC